MSDRTTKAGTVTIGYTDLTADIEAFLRAVVPSTSKMMDREFELIEKNAREEWPKRQTTKRWNKRTRSFTFKDESQESWKAFKRGTRIENGNIVVFLKNTASYAWAIKIGKNSENARGEDIFLTQGKRVAQALMISPLRPASRRIAKALADDLVRRY